MKIMCDRWTDFKCSIVISDDSNAHIFQEIYQKCTESNIAEKCILRIKVLVIRAVISNIRLCGRIGNAREKIKIFLIEIVKLYTIE